MTIADAFAPAEASYKAQVLGATFGHLAPEPAKVYSGYIVFTHASYGGTLAVIDAHFDGLNDSPWLFDHMQDFCFANSEERGVVYRFEGTYRVFKNGNHRFTGKITALYTPR